MKHKTLFRLALKVMGVCFFAAGAFRCVGASGWLVVSLTDSGFGGSFVWSYGLNAVGFFLEAGFGLYLFFGGEWIVNRAIPSNRPYCHECGYDLTGAATNRCPECDTPFSPADVRPPQESS